VLQKSGCIYLVLPAAVILAPPLQAQQFGESILVEQPVARDLYLAGRNIDILADVDGDVVAAGRHISVTGRISQDVITAGEDVLIQGSLQDDLRAAGRTVNLTGSVAGHVTLAGQSVMIGAESEIGDWAWLAGETIDINGSVHGEVRAAGRTIVINGEVGGNVELMGDDLRVGPNAVIHGDLTWRSPHPLDQSSSARIHGRVLERQGVDGRSGDRDWFEEDDGGIGSYMYSVLSMAAGAIAVYLLFPAYTRKAAELVRSEPGTSLGTGLAVLLITPVMCLLLFITLIGLLPGLVLLAFYCGFLLLGILLGVITITYFGLRQAGKDAAATRMTWVLGILAAAALLALLWEIPLLGGLLFLLVWIFGLGGAGLALVRKIGPAEKAA
jgi:predicted acyltransferase (DUF342 family)